MEFINDTIVALASGPIKAAISLIRVSGNDSFKMVDHIFSNTKNHESHRVYYGHIIDNNEVIDEVMVTFYKGPKSFSGEDMVEITCHGNMIIVSKIIELLIKQGARIANPGEFSKRAFLFNRIDLVNAEAINDIINATSENAIKLALSGMNGNTSSYVNKLANDLINVISQIEVNIDYPEYDDIEQLRYDSVLPSINKFLETLDLAIQDSKKGMLIRDGLNLAIIGSPNVGKSSLLNALIKEDKAIVSDIAGTTRDIVEGRINIAGVTLNLIDTAGMHESSDELENMGIERSKKAIDKADIILAVFDGSKKLSNDDEEILKATNNKNRIIIINKADKETILDIKGAIHISAKNNDIKELELALEKKYQNLKYNNEPLLFNTRQIGLLKQAKDHLIEAKNQALNGQVIDIISIDLKEAYNSILDILGKNNKKDLLDNIFSKFCLGK